MTAPQRLIEADDEFERDLIRSAHADRPSSRALERTLIGLGVQFYKLPSALASPAPTAAMSGKVGGLVLAKWLVTGVVIGVAGITGAQAVGHALTQHARHATEAPEPVAAHSNARAVAASDRAPRATVPDVTGSASQTAPSTAPPSARPRPTANLGLETPAPPRAASAIAAESSKPSASTALPAVGSFALEAAHASRSGLADEMRVLDGVRRALATGAPRSALSALGNYEHAFPQGALRPEAAVLKVRALLAAGDRAGAEALGQRIIERAPRSEHADAVRAELAHRTNP